MGSTGRGGAGGSSGKQAKNGMKTTKSEFWGQHSRGDKPICIQWLQNWLHEHQCICKNYDHMRHQRLKSYIGYSSLAGGSAGGDSAGGRGELGCVLQTSHLNIMERSLRNISSPIFVVIMFGKNSIKVNLCWNSWNNVLVHPHTPTWQFAFHTWYDKIRSNKLLTKENYWKVIILVKWLVCNLMSTNYFQN